MIESGVELLSRITQRPKLDQLNTTLFPDGGPLPSQLVEITGEPNVGKTIMIMDLIAKCLLPTIYGGKGSGAIIVNTDHHFHLFRLISIMEYYIKAFEKSHSCKSHENVIDNSLSNLLILNCYNSDQLMVTFMNVENIILRNANISLVALDSISAYYWMDRLSSDISFNAYFSQIIATLHAIAKRFNVTVFYTKGQVIKQSFNTQEDYKIILKKATHENIFQAQVLNSDNSFIICRYKISKTIEFL